MLNGNKELQSLLLKERKRFMEALDHSVEYNSLKDIRIRLRAIATEMDKRRLKRDEIYPR